MGGGEAVVIQLFDSSNEICYNSGMSEKLKHEIDLYFIDLLTDKSDEKKKTHFYMRGNNLGYNKLLPPEARHLSREELFKILKGAVNNVNLFTGSFFSYDYANGHNYKNQNGVESSGVWTLANSILEDNDGSKFEADTSFDLTLMTLQLLVKFKSTQIKNIELFNCSHPPGFAPYGANYYDLFTKDNASLINYYNGKNNNSFKLSATQICSIINNLSSDSVNRRNCYDIANFALNWLDVSEEERGQIIRATFEKFKSFFKKPDNCNTFYNYILQNHSKYKEMVKTELQKVSEAFVVDVSVNSFTFNENKVQHLNINMSSLIAKYPALLGANHLKANFETIIKRCIKISSPIAFKSNLNIEFIDFYGQEKFGKNIAFKTKSDFISLVDDKNTASIIEFAFSKYISLLNTELTKFKTSSNAGRINFERDDVLMMMKAYESEAMEHIEAQIQKGVTAFVDKLSLEGALVDIGPEVGKLSSKIKGEQIKSVDGAIAKVKHIHKI